MTAPEPGGGNTYALVRVEQVDTPTNEALPSINLTLPAIKKVKYMNMKIPAASTTSSGGLGSQVRGGLAEEVDSPTQTPEPDSALGHLQVLLVKTAGGSLAKLYMRKVVKCHSSRYDTVSLPGLRVLGPPRAVVGAALGGAGGHGKFYYWV